MSYDAKRIGTRLRKLREEAGLSRPVLAARVERAGHSLAYNTLTAFENGTRNMSVEQAVRLAEALGVPVCALTGDHAEFSGSEYHPTQALLSDVMGEDDAYVLLGIAQRAVGAVETGRTSGRRRKPRPVQ